MYRVHSIAGLPPAKTEQYARRRSWLWLQGNLCCRSFEKLEVKFYITAVRASSVLHCTSTTLKSGDRQICKLQYVRSPSACLSIIFQTPLLCLKLNVCVQAEANSLSSFQVYYVIFNSGASCAIINHCQSSYSTIATILTEIHHVGVTFNSGNKLLPFIAEKHFSAVAQPDFV